MGRGILKNLLALVVALVVTAGVIVVCNAATKASPDAAAEISRQARQEAVQVQELAAPAHPQEPVPFLEAAAGFVLVLAACAAGALLLLRTLRRGHGPKPGRGYQPRRDMAHGARPVRRV